MKHEKKETLWWVSSELEEHLQEVKNDFDRILQGYESTIATTEKATLAVREFKNMLSDKNIRSLDDFLNFYLFINLFQLDILVVLHRYLLSKIRYELVFFGKSSALLSFEYLNSIHGVYKNFAQNCPVILQKDLDSMRLSLKEFAKIKKRYPHLQTIRNSIAAHRPNNSFIYLDITSQMNSYDYINLIQNILEVNTSLSLIVEGCLKKIDVVFKKHLP